MAAYNQYLNQPLAAYSEAFELMSATKHLYDIITAHYAVLFNPSTPLHLDCSMPGNFDLLGSNEGLRRAFDITRAEALNFCNRIPPLVLIIHELTNIDNARTHFIDQDRYLKEDIISKEQKIQQRL